MPKYTIESMEGLPDNIKREMGLLDKLSVRNVSGRKEESTLDEILFDSMFAPSRELAWLIALLSSGGYVSQRSGRIKLSSREVELHETFKSVVNRVFRRDVHLSHVEKYGYSEFIDRRVARTLGFLGRQVWQDTVISRFSWIIDNSEYAWGFLSGLYDEGGSTKNNAIRIYSSTISGANFITELMVLMGVERLRMEKVGNGRGRRVVISYQGDLKLFADNVKSVVTWRDQNLEEYRGQRTLRRYEPAPEDLSQLVAEWGRIYHLLGKVPSVKDIFNLYNTGQTRWSAGTYGRAFGRTETGSGFSYTIASEKLVSTLGIDSAIYTKVHKHMFAKGVEAELLDYKYRVGQEIRYTPKSHPKFNEEARRRWDTILKNAVSIANQPV
jgi:hypothetical protein